MTDLTNLWTQFTRTVFLCAISSHVVVPSLLTISILNWVPQIPLWFRPLSQGTLGILLLYLVLGTPIAADLLTKGLTGSVPTYHGELADAIVVLGRGDELGLTRYDLAIQLWQQERAPKIFVTSLGRIGYMTSRLKREGLPLRALSGTTCARTTYEEALSAAVLLKPGKAEQIILITDPAHMQRAWLTFQKIGFKVLPYSAPYLTDFSNLNRSILALREYLGLAYYASLKRLSKQVIVYSAEQKSNIDPLACTVRWLRYGLTNQPSRA